MKLGYINYIISRPKFFLITTYLLTGFFNYSCNLSKSGAADVTNQNDNNRDSLLLIPKQFLELESNSNGYCLVRGKVNLKVIALTFDDGPTDLTLQILTLLDKHNAKATFFCREKIYQIMLIL